jgi:hypothetical protein|tara:strand:+ start:89 stop:331 length:243 start_codon:yes stop_codon:yes gene_type:complete
MKVKVPIWMSDWTFEQKNGFQYVIKDVLVKGLTKEEIMNNDMLVTRALKKLSKGTKKYKLKAVNVKLKSQHGYGPRYEDE